MQGESRKFIPASVQLLGCEDKISLMWLNLKGETLAVLREHFSKVLFGEMLFSNMMLPFSHLS